MNGNSRFSQWFGLFVGAAIVFALLGALVSNDIGSVPDETHPDETAGEQTYENEPMMPNERGTRGSSPRTVLAQLFTNWGCGPCTQANPPINDLLDVYDRSQLVMISYHMSWPSSTDPFYLYNTEENDIARTYYGVSGVPSMYFDGPPNVSHNGASTYGYYKGFIDSELANLSPMTITLDGFVYGSTGNITADIDVTDTLPGGTLRVRFGVVEDNRWASGPNGEVRHRYVMRNMLAEENLPALGIGATYTVSREFPMNGTYDPESISIVVFVQNDSGQDVLQAAYYDFIPEDVLVVDDDEDSHPHGSEDTYHELLTYMGYSFDGWALDERGSPSESDLAPYEAVIWLTGSTTATLTTADQTAISGYLDNGKGSLFLTGENVGADIGSSPFYSDYLYAFYIDNDTGENQVNGVQFDPISDTYFGSPLPISDNSPSWILPLAPATGTFKYFSGGNDAGLRVEHDLDSRVVYFAFLYFEGSDSFNDKAGVLFRVLNWMVVSIDDIIFRDAPGESGNALESIAVDVGQSVTVWAAAYNNTNGFIGNYGTTMWVEDSKGSLITVTSPGSSTLIQAGLTSDSVSLTARCFTYMNTTTVTVNPPTVDFIQIMDAPNGTGSIVSAVELNVGMDVTLWAAGYNLTTGFVEDVPVTIWTEDSSGNLVTVTSPGMSSTITALLTGGMCNVTADANGAQGTATITINDATPDYIQILDSAGGAGSVVLDDNLNVGEDVTLWAAAFNITSGWLFDIPTADWTEDSSGSVVTLSQPAGAFTTVQAGTIGGVVIVTVEYAGLQNTSEITVNPPTGDFIVIRDTPGGLGSVVDGPIYPVGTTFYYWGAVYNNTAGYLKDVPSYASWSSDNMGLVQVAPMGTNTFGQISDTEGGSALITLEVDGLSNSTTITVISPTVDYVYIRDAPDGGGEVVNIRQYEVGESDTFYAASYNGTAGYLGDVPSLWDCNDGSVGTIPASGSSAVFDALGIGSCIVSIEFGGLQVQTGTITVVDTTDPVAVIGSDFAIDEDTIAYFNATLSGDNSAILFYNWSFGDGTTRDGSETGPSHTYLDPGIYTVTLTVTDTGGNSDTAEITVTVRDITSPTAAITVQDTVEEDVDCKFNGSDSTDNGGIVSYAWEFGDGTSTAGSLANVLHAYGHRGTYTVNLTVADAAGNTDTAWTTILVLDVTPPAKPSGLVITQVATGETLIVSWEPVTDSDLDHYEIYCSENSGDFSKLGTIDSDVTEYTHENLINGVTYRYYVVAVDFAGNPSPDSSTVTGIPDTDTDGDGTFDLVDKDDDDDGLSDIKEAQAGSDPLNRDSDEDTYIDGEDAFPVNPKEWEDSDGDGYGDNNEDAFPKDPDEWKDSDGDGVGDNSDFLPTLNNILFFIIIIAVIAAVLVVALMARKRGGEAVEFTDFEAAPAAPAPPMATQPAPPPPPWMAAQKVKSEAAPESREMPPPPAKKEVRAAKEAPAAPEAPAPASGEEATQPAAPAAESTPAPPPAAKPRPPRPPAAAGGQKPRPPRTPKKAKETGK